MPPMYVEKLAAVGKFFRCKTSFGNEDASPFNHFRVAYGLHPS